MATFNFFDQFSEDVANGVHNLGADTLEFYLSNATPSQSTDEVKADLPEISTGNGYTGPVDAQNALSRTDEVASITGVDATITASGGSVGPFQYVVLQNTTPTSPLDPVIGWWDYGSGVTLADGESFDIDVGSSLFTISFTP